MIIKQDVTQIDNLFEIILKWTIINIKKFEYLCEVLVRFSLITAYSSACTYKQFLKYKFSSCMYFGLNRKSVIFLEFDLFVCT